MIINKFINMYLSKTAYRFKPYHLTSYSIRCFSAKEYDLAVIGGGPGGTFILNQTLL